MFGEILNARLHMVRFGKGLQRALREESKQGRTIQDPIRKGEKERGARLRGIPGRERPT
jgi:hypothetical protein